MSKKYTTDNITISEALNDGSGVGTSGQVLSSTGSGVSWIDGSGIVGGPYLAADRRDIKRHPNYG